MFRGRGIRAQHIPFEAILTMTQLTSLLRAAIIATIAAAILPVLAAAQAKPWISHDCGNGVSLRISSPAALQGGLLQAEVRSAATLTGIDATWADHALPFWPVAPSANVQRLNGQGAKVQRANIQRALLGIDLEEKSGEYEVSFAAQLPGGEQVSCSARVTVKEGKFPVESLKVAPEFVEPKPEDVERANKEGQRLRELFATATPERMWRGSFRLPLPGATNARNFGRRRVLNGQPHSPHTGVDFPAPAGTLIHASQRGRVVLAENLYFSGNTVLLDHGLGVYTFYGHMSSISVSVGDVVSPGAILGRVGATGRVTGPHLHWGLTVNQARVNPLQIVGLPGQ
jgi:murein DD-endopeptidase MepM/ murein hydrolase activator NlpD